MLNLELYWSQSGDTLEIVIKKQPVFSMNWSYFSKASFLPIKADLKASEVYIPDKSLCNKQSLKMEKILLDKNISNLFNTF